MTPRRRTLDDIRHLFINDTDECVYLPRPPSWAKGNGYDEVVVSGKRWLAHRLSYEINVGPIPAGMVIDHVCHNIDLDCVGVCPHRRCINPRHLDVVTRARNALTGRSPSAQHARQEFCIRGHPFEVKSDGKRYCYTCVRDRFIATGEMTGIGQPRTRSHCKRGHPFDEANTRYTTQQGGKYPLRVCRTCVRENQRKYAEARRIRPDEEID